MNNQLVEFLKRADLPSLPQTATQLFVMADDEEVEIRELARLVRIDPAMTAKVLRLVNSVFYGFERRIVSLEEAIPMIGLNALRQLCLSFSILDIMKDMGIDESIMDTGDFWQHSFACAAGAHVLAPHLGVEQQEEAFVAGLLHDLGKLLIAEFAPQKQARALIMARLNEMPLYEAERKALGITHLQMGEGLADFWNLPPRLVTCVRFSHGGFPKQPSPEFLDAQPLVKTVILGNYLAKSMSIGDSGCPLAFTTEEVLNYAGIKNQEERERVLYQFGACIEEYGALIESKDYMQHVDSFDFNEEPQEDDVDPNDYLHNRAKTYNRRRIV